MRSLKYHILIFIFFIGVKSNVESKDCLIGVLENLPDRFNFLTKKYDTDRISASIQKLPPTKGLKKGSIRIVHPQFGTNIEKSFATTGTRKIKIKTKPLSGIIRQYFNRQNIYSPKNNLPFDSIGNKNQDLDKVLNFPSKFFTKINGKISSLQRRLDKQSTNYINKLLKNESHLKKEMLRVDSNAAKNVFSINASDRYNTLLRQLKTDSTDPIRKNFSGEYYPYIDSLQTALIYMDKNSQLMESPDVTPGKIKSTLKNLMVLRSRMQNADQIKQYIQQRREQLKASLTKFTNLSSGITKAYQNYNKQFYYYSEQVKEFKETLNDPDKAMKLALTILNKVPAFSNFMKKNSLLASIFNLTGTYSPSTPGQGMSTRDQVLASFQNGIINTGGPNPSSIVQQNLQSAQNVANKLTDKFKSYNNNNTADIDIPNFHPNNQIGISSDTGIMILR